LAIRTIWAIQDRCQDKKPIYLKEKPIYLLYETGVPRPDPRDLTAIRRFCSTYA